MTPTYTLRSAIACAQGKRLLPRLRDAGSHERRQSVPDRRGEPTERSRAVLSARRMRAGARRRLRRGAYLLPSMFTLANMFCGYACVVYALRGEFRIAAPLIGIAIVLDMLDGRIARMTGTSSAFGLELDSLADVISFGMAPSILAFSWGLHPLGARGWGVGFIFVVAAALRLARFNIQSGSVDKRYFVGLPSPAAASVPAATVFAYPDALQLYPDVVPLFALLMVIVPSWLMVSTVRFRSFKTFDLRARRSYRNLILFAIGLAAIASQPEAVLLAMSYAYLASGLVGMFVSRVRRRPAGAGSSEPQAESPADVSRG
jgi:CDP-diacylglycerol--serine O-phosphatidyltransferase